MKISPEHLRGAADWVDRVRTDTLTAEDPAPCYGTLFATRRTWLGRPKLDGACAIGVVALLAYGPAYAFSDDTRTGHFLESVRAQQLSIYLMSAYGYFDAHMYAASARALRNAAEALEAGQKPVRETPPEPEWLASELIAVLRAEYEGAGVA